MMIKAYFNGFQWIEVSDESNVPKVFLESYCEGPLTALSNGTLTKKEDNSFEYIMPEREDNPVTIKEFTPTESEPEEPKRVVNLSDIELLSQLVLQNELMLIYKELEMEVL